jgi:hypothetical protein
MGNPAVSMRSQKKIRLMLGQVNEVKVVFLSYMTSSTQGIAFRLKKHNRVWEKQTSRGLFFQTVLALSQLEQDRTLRFAANIW